jgi:hypothetical protein
MQEETMNTVTVTQQNGLGIAAQINEAYARNLGPIEVNGRTVATWPLRSAANVYQNGTLSVSVLCRSRNTRSRYTEIFVKIGQSVTINTEA